MRRFYANTRRTAGHHGFSVNHATVIVQPVLMIGQPVGKIFRRARQRRNRRKVLGNQLHRAPVEQHVAKIKNDVHA